MMTCEVLEKIWSTTENCPLRINFAERGALVFQPPAQQAVFEGIDFQGCLAHDSHEHISLVVHQVVEQFHRRIETTAFLHGLAQPVD